MVKKFNPQSKNFDLGVGTDVDAENLKLLHEQLVADNVPHEYSLNGIIIEDKDLTQAEQSKAKVLWQA